MQGRIQAIFKQCAPDTLTTKDGEKIDYISLLVEDDSTTKLFNRLVNFSMLKDTYDSMNANELNSLVNRRCLFEGKLTKRYGGGLRFYVEKISLVK